MALDNAIGNLQDFAVEKGASSSRVIAVEDISVEHWVRQKCQYGCGGYARHFTCPPYSPSPEETKNRLQGYKQALLVNFADIKPGEKPPNVHEVMYDMEREAFLSGFYKAFAYAAGPCRICGTCVAEQIQNPNEFSKKECKQPVKARPSMEAVGIDVFQTARSAGYKIDVVKQRGDCYTRFGLLLLE